MLVQKASAASHTRWHWVTGTSWTPCTKNPSCPEFRLHEDCHSHLLSWHCLSPFLLGMRTLLPWPWQHHAPFQGFLFFTMPISVGNGIFFGTFPKQRETKPMILWLVEFSLSLVSLPTQGVIPLVAPVSQQQSTQAPWGICFLTRAGVKINVHLTCGVTLIVFCILLGKVILILVRGFWVVTQKSRGGVERPAWWSTNPSAVPAWAVGRPAGSCLAPWETSLRWLGGVSALATRPSPWDGWYAV